ncbi:hypothetical protein AMATHDRAFT_55950 [Amanita thiersii Skay4041]|uniref:SHSP domain-containing protein n=1 Tax=Amanita thiersii Skay4041 TaxID=703135 RepID=A0A2A9NYK4_9AGAR|nr:hypothetical protein AMATHDRAFT_55950 [Amanita thiersii Skay4041]
MPAYPRARQDHATTTSGGGNTSTRSPNDRLQPFREPTNSHINTNAVASSSRHIYNTAGEHQLSPVTPAVTGIVYPTEEVDYSDQDVEPREAAYPVINATNRHHQRYTPTTNGHNGNYYDHNRGNNNNSSNHRYNSTTSTLNTNRAQQNYSQTPHGNNMAGSSQDENSSDQAGGETRGEDTSLDQIWDVIREKKARKMAKERAKVESLEEITGELALSDHPLHPTIDPLTMSNGHQQRPQPQQQHSTTAYQQAVGNSGETVSVPVPISHDLSPQAATQEPSHKPIRRRKSIVSFRESRDGRSINATIELPPEVKKQDIHISFNAKRLVISWMVIDLTEWEEDDGRIVRERVEQIFQRTLPVGEGTKYEEVKSFMIKNKLILRYPNMRCIRVEPRHSDDS